MSYAKENSVAEFLNGPPGTYARFKLLFDVFKSHLKFGKA